MPFICSCAQSLNPPCVYKVQKCFYQIHWGKRSAAGLGFTILLIPCGQGWDLKSFLSPTSPPLIRLSSVKLLTGCSSSWLHKWLSHLLKPSRYFKRKTLPSNIMMVNVWWKKVLVIRFNRCLRLLVLLSSVCFCVCFPDPAQRCAISVPFSLPGFCPVDPESTSTVIFLRA